MRRREFIAGLGSAAVACPIAARAQQGPSLPVIGYLTLLDKPPDTPSTAAFRRGIGEQGYVEGRNVEILCPPCAAMTATSWCSGGRCKIIEHNPAERLEDRR